MSKLFKPKITRPVEPESKPLDQVQDRGRVGRTILAGKKATEVKTERKTILGG